jgi:hypothetical protein
MHRARYLSLIALSLLLVLSSACEGFGEEPPKIYASQIAIEYPDGMTVANGSTIRFLMENKSIYCIKFQIQGSFPVFVYLQDGSSVQVQNTRTYINPIMKLNLVSTSKSRRMIEVTPVLAPHDENYRQALFKAYVPLEGFDCEDPTVTVNKKIPFFIQYYTDY